MVLTGRFDQFGECDADGTKEGKSVIGFPPRWCTQMERDIPLCLLPSDNPAAFHK